MSIENEGMSRRSFISGAAATGVALAGLAASTGVAFADDDPEDVAEGAEEEAAEEEAAAEGEEEATEEEAAEEEEAEEESTTSEYTVGYDGTGVMPWLGEAPEITDDMVEEELDADVVIVGLGCAGVPAARSAVEAGANVICLEASSSLNSAASDMAIFGGETQATWGRGDGYMDKKTIVNMHMEECSHHVKQSIISRYYDDSGAALDWFISCSDVYVAPESYAEIPEESQDNYMFPYMYPMLENYDYTEEALPCYPTSVGFSALGTVMAENLQVAVDGGANVLYDTKGVELIMGDDGAVAGIYAQALDSENYIKINAPAVVLATGDYIANEDMLKFYCPEAVENGVSLMSMNRDANGDATCVGDGHKMAVWAGASVDQWHAPMIHHMGGSMGNNGFLWLNVDGERFMNEDVPGQQLENQIELQPQRKGYQFFDSEWRDQLQYFPAAHGTKCIYSEDDLPDYTCQGLSLNVMTESDFQSALESGSILQADTLEDLLAQIDIDAETALASIERYNELCAAGEDEDFFKSSKRLFALENPPYYVIENGVTSMLCALGGLESDEDCHVYNTDREVITGLYACGAPQGGRFAVQYPISLKGLSSGMCMVFGKIAGENAANLA